MKTFTKYLAEGAIEKSLSAEVKSKFGATINISVTDMFLRLTKIKIPEEERGKGNGKKAMLFLIAYADEHDLVMALTPSSDLGTKKTILTKFYKSLGFVKNTEYKYDVQETMIKNPDF